jgi:hypothetical protein
VMHRGIVAAVKVCRPAQEAEVRIDRGRHARGFITSCLTIAFFLLPIACFAAGGTCPSGATYTNPVNPTGSLVTLSSLGVTSCYFVSAAGSDSSYDGTSETVSGSHGPFLHAPYMPNCASNCATLQAAMNGTAAAGLGFIFRGGDTWHFGASTSPATGGTWNINVSPYPAGTSSNPIYLGVDRGWYSGGSWARPILTGDNSVCNSGTTGTMPDGATCTSNPSSTCTAGSGSACTGLYYVSSCAYQTGSSNVMFNMTSAAYYIVDNLEMTGLCESELGQVFGDDIYISYGSADGPLTFSNLYIHGASHVRFAGPNSSSSCTASNVCVNIRAFVGAVLAADSGGTGENILLNVVDFSDSDPQGAQLIYGGFYNVAYNVFRYFANAIPGTLHLWHDNLEEYFYEDGHSNLIESEDRATTNAIYNNVFRHIEVGVTSGGGVGLWLGPQSGVTDYIFNNLMYDVGNFEYLNLGGQGLTSNTGNYVWFNNTFQTNINQPIFRCNSSTLGTSYDVNDHYIDDGAPYLTSGGQSSSNTCTGSTSTTSLWQSNTSGGSAPNYSDANTSPHYDQYTSSETYAYSPVASTNSTAGAGTNETSGYCAAMLASGDSLIQAAGTACKSDFPSGVSYNATNHTVSYAGQTVVARQPSGAWDVGAYQFSSSVTGQTLQPSTNLSATVH